MIASLLSSPSRFDRVLRLLDEERRTLLKGPIADLAGLVERREALIAEILAQETVIPQGFLTALKARAERNGHLIKAAIAGVKSAAAEVARIDEAQGRLRTYSAAGAQVDFARTRVTRDTRA
ncbi:hypothetical protein [Amaricoccus sp.]|uniref:hypothetical protein n=1 Tax=Amaricoccus sp. TaxID=1872485 RepID=UPI001B4E8E87|nr:hypothetical protein [Amaricoccus sp.]MBP7242975.1 hypothetical protein [Amaricoccus sp.]